MLVDEIFEIARKKYSLQPDQSYEPLTDKKKRMISCQLLMEEMEFKGALNQEKANLLLYMAVLVNADKEKLDWKRAYEELKINDLINFYY